MKTFNSVGYLAPEFEVTDVITERGFAEGRLGSGKTQITFNDNK